MQLTLVVRRAATDDAPVTHERLERRGLPELDRVDRLHVVVAVDQDRRRARRVEPVGVDDRMAGRARRLGVLEPDAGQLRGDPVRGADHVRRVLRQRGDRRDPQELEQALEPQFGIRLEVGIKIGVDGDHRRRW